MVAVRKRSPKIRLPWQLTHRPLDVDMLHVLQGARLPIGRCTCSPTASAYVRLCEVDERGMAWLTVQCGSCSAEVVHRGRPDAVRAAA